tara:strand:+ start:156 stop:482 length:327 start_codon:yes stop_codon:yes gene_type:complete
MIHKFWKPNEPINGGKYLIYCFLSIFAFIIPPLGMTLLIVLTYRRLKTIGITNNFLAGLLSLLILPIAFLFIGFFLLLIGIIENDTGVSLYIFSILSLVSFVYLIIKK